MPSEPPTTADCEKIRATEVSRPVDAPQWALMHGMDIAARYFYTFSERAALAADIAEALYQTAPPLGGGIGKCCLVCHGSGRDYAGEKSHA